MLQIGYLLPTRDQSVLGVHEPRALVAQARRAEKLGLDSVWAGDSPVCPALRRVARLADGWLPYPTAATTYARERATVERAASRAVTPALYATLCIDEDPQRAHRRLRTSIERYYDAPVEFVASVQALFAGTARAAADRLNGYVAAGARHLVIRLATEDHDAGLEELADQVLPLLRKENRQ